ncbi:DNA topoisomerase VI subunit B [Pyrococcus yayanosii]|uniref:Type 2 DNA topoisomerase 6 subunit B n=1 Tax=Pyrococcus yayanosii (strain CH1 / JCM 16557) TaxID=529709 RepID=F8AGY5_PYRYC|nr:DNA topoisomerase VI subunit B [Pyrococcus yayanosii]AEH24043.1 DNA topoisomerase VI subunit B [Pyrococcus yayanosii CH1]
MAEAKDIFKEFKVQSVSEFFRRNAAMLGYTGKVRSLTTIVHEAVTNSLDACEEAGILPYIRVEIEELGKEHYKIIVEDNGPGIPEKFIPHVFGKMLAGTKAHRNIQSRGQQGIGISGAVMFAQITSGKATRVITSTGGDIVEAWVKIDVQKNEGKIVKKVRHPNPKGWRGTRIELEVKDVRYVRSKQGVYWYLKLTAIANPHAHIELIEPDGKLIIFPRSSEEIPKPPVEMKPHPKGVMTDDVYTMAHKTGRSTVRRFLVSEFSRISDKKVDELVKYIAALRLIKEEDDKAVRDQIYERLANGDVDGVLKSFGRKWRKVVREVEKIMEKPPEKLTWHEAEEIVEAFKLMKFLAPPTHGLRPIGEENIEKGLMGILKPEFVTAVTRAPRVYAGGIPFQVEVGLAYGGQITGPEILRYANRVPLLFDAGSCVITSAVRSIDWKRYRIDSFENAPLVVMVNVVSVHVPYTSTGKQSIADVEEIYNEIRLAIMDAARKLATYLGGKYRRLYQVKRRKTFEKYLPEITRSLHIITGEPEEKIKEYFLNLIESRFQSIEGIEEVAENEA